jgi:hypothetical protein
MRNGYGNLNFLIGFISLTIGLSNSFAQDAAINVQCFTETSGNTSCESLSPNATTASAVFAGTGKINKVKLRNIESTPVIIENKSNTDTMILYGEVDNRGRAQDLTVDVQSKFNVSTAANWMLKAPNSGSSLIIADSVKNLNLFVNGYSGSNGRNLSSLCGDRAMLAKLARNVQTCNSQKSLGILTGYFLNPNCDQSIIDANLEISTKVEANHGLCSSVQVLNTITKMAPPNFCQADHFYLKERDGATPPSLKFTNPIGDLSDFVGDPAIEAPVRLRFLNKCVKNEVFRSCKISGNVSVDAPLLNFSNDIGDSSFSGFVNQLLTVEPVVTTPDGSPLTNCVIAASPNSQALPQTLSVDPKTCTISGTPTQTFSGTYFVTATNIAGSSSPTMLKLTIKISDGSTINNPNIIGSTDTPTSAIIYINKSYSEVRTSCSDYFTHLKSNKDIPNKEACYPDQPGPADCLKVLETKTEIRDVINYYAQPTEASEHSCPNAGQGEVFEKFTQDHLIEPYTPEIKLSAEYEQQNCTYGNCPGVTDTYTFSENAAVNFPIEAGESGSYGGRADVFAYDIATTNFTFANGANGSNGSADMSIPSVTKYCAKIVDARGLNGVQSIESTTSSKQPLVNFHKSSYYPMSFSLPTLVPGTAFPKRTQDQAIGIFKKVDSSVRQFIINEYIEPRFQ